MQNLPLMAKCSRCPRLVPASEMCTTPDGQRICPVCMAALHPTALDEAEQVLQRSLRRTRRKVGGIMVLLGAAIGAAALFTGVRALAAWGAALIVGGVVRVLTAGSG